MSRVLKLKLSDDQIERLNRIAVRTNEQPSEMAASLLEEGLRLREFPCIEIRDSAAGRQAYLRGSRVQAWWIANLAWNEGQTAEDIAALLDLMLPYVQCALAYAATFPDEMREAIADNNRPVEELVQIIPNLHVITIDSTDS